MSATTPRKKATPGTPTEPLEDFEYTTKGGEKIVLPPFKSAKPGVLRKIRKLDMADQFFTVLESLLDGRRGAEIKAARENEPDADLSDKEIEKNLGPDPTLDIIDDLDSDDFQAFQRAWFKHSGIDLGE